MQFILVRFFFGRLNGTDSRNSIALMALEMKGRLNRPCFDSISTWRGIERIPACSLSPACKTGPLIWARVTIFTGVRRLVRSLSYLSFPTSSSSISLSAWLSSRASKRSSSFFLLSSVSFPCRSPLVLAMTSMLSRPTYRIIGACSWIKIIRILLDCFLRDVQLEKKLILI